MLKTIAKYCAIISLFAVSNDAFSTNIYTKMMPDYESVRKLEDSLLPILDIANEQTKGELVYNSSDWHMTIQPTVAPDYLSITELRDWSNYHAQQFNLKNLPRQLKRITDTISTIDFRVEGVEPFGGRNKFIVLTLEPILDHIEDIKLQKKIRKRILENRPHISLSRYSTNIPISNHKISIILTKVREAVRNINIKIRFDTTVAEAQKGSPINIYSNRGKVAAY